jgi:hypothetical protein
VTHEELQAGFTAHKRVRGRCLDSAFPWTAPVPFPSVDGNPPQDPRRPFYDVLFHQRFNDDIIDREDQI